MINAHEETEQSFDRCFSAIGSPAKTHDGERILSVGNDDIVRIDLIGVNYSGIFTCSDTGKRCMKKSGWKILAVAMLFPTVLTFLYFVVFADSGVLQRLAFGIGKPLQFSIPIFWIAVVRRERWLLRPFTWRGVGEGTLFGLAVFVAMLGLYIVWLGHHLLGPDSSAVREIHSKVNGMGISDARLFLFFGLFYAVFHSGLEEYYWRWFVFGMLRRGMPSNYAMVLSSVAFAAHHVLLLGTYFGYTSPFCWIGSLGVAVGGLYWAWLYQRSDSIWGPWIGHGIVDAAIFGVGYLTCFGESHPL